MKTKECPSCAMEIDAKAETCPICGYDFPKTPLYLKIVAVLMILLLIFYYIL